MEPKLLKCPFCNGHAQIVYNNCGYDYTSEKFFPLKKATVMCRNCGLRLPRYYSADRAIEMWNRRA